MFELLDRDAAARLCKWKISDYEIKTPNIAIVVNPNRQVIAPAEMKKEFGVEIIITNSDIITPVDIFTLPKDDYKTANKKLKQTLARIATARKVVSHPQLLNGTIQG